MTRNNSDWVNDHFAATATDWTPASVRQAARVLYAPVSRDPDVLQQCQSILSEAEQKRAERFVAKDGKAHFVQRRAFRRYCGALALGSMRPLSLIRFQETAKGRPYLADCPELWLSFSSCQSGFLAAWSSMWVVGVDIEDSTRNVEALELAQRFYSQAEAQVVSSQVGPARLQTFLRLWTLKEAALKSIGEGLPFGLDAFAFELFPHQRIVEVPQRYARAARFSAHETAGANTCAAIVIREVNGNPHDPLDGGEQPRVVVEEEPA